MFVSFGLVGRLFLSVLGLVGSVGLVGLVGLVGGLRPVRGRFVVGAVLSFGFGRFCLWVLSTSCPTGCSLFKLHFFLGLAPRSRLLYLPLFGCLWLQASALVNLRLLSCSFAS